MKRILNKLNKNEFKEYATEEQYDITCVQRVRNE